MNKLGIRPCLSPVASRSRCRFTVIELPVQFQYLLRECRARVDFPGSDVRVTQKVADRVTVH